MTTPVRISAQAAREKSQSGEALLVCAYEESQKFKDNNLEGALTWQSFESRLPDLNKSDEIIFYCA